MLSTGAEHTVAAEQPPRRDRHHGARRDGLYTGLIWATILVCLAGGAAIALGGLPLPHAAILLFFCLLAAGFLVWSLYGTSYTITARELRVRCGPFRWRLELAAITRVEPTRSLVSSAALASERLRIRSRGHLELHISPRDTEAFLRDLQAADPGLVARGGSLFREPGRGGGRANGAPSARGPVDPLRGDERKDSGPTGGGPSGIAGDDRLPAWLALAFLGAVLLSQVADVSPGLAADRITGKTFATRSEVIAPHGMAATSQPLATMIAIDILQAGGSAVDAAIAADAALGLMEPTGSGIGGDLFAIVWDAKSQRLYGLNASGRSPRSLTLEEFQRRKLSHVPHHGPLPVTVPGCVDGWFELHERFGRLPMAQILAPAVRYAREGFPVSELIAYYWQLSVPILKQWPGFLETFTHDGRAPRTGQMWRNPALANTYELIGREGRDAFYRGRIARTIDRFMAREGGFLSYEDLASHTSTWVEPVSTDYRGWDVWELPPNGQGIAALQILNILEGFDLAAAGFGSPMHIHLFVEAKKLAFEDRARWYADPAFADVPVTGLISKEYAAERRALIDLHRAARRYEAGDPLPFDRATAEGAGGGAHGRSPLDEGDTVYLTVADSDRNMVSLIQSNYRGMGSGMCPDSLGFCLQDRGELFNLAPGHANTYEPGKRPFHTIIPAFVTRNGKPFMSFGVMGGATQPQAHAQIIMNMVDFGMGLQEAGDAPRILHSGSSQPTGEEMAGSGRVSLESGFSYETIRALTKMGHDVGWEDGPYGGYQAILYDAEQGVYHGASESRKDGMAAGY